MLYFKGKECGGFEGSVDKIDVEFSSTIGTGASQPNIPCKEVITKEKLRNANIKD